jgi:hypothetical protein
MIERETEEESAAARFGSSPTRRRLRYLYEPCATVCVQWIRGTDEPFTIVSLIVSLLFLSNDAEKLRILYIKKKEIEV